MRIIEPGSTRPISNNITVPPLSSHQPNILSSKFYISNNFVPFKNLIAAYLLCTRKDNQSFPFF
ncbi:hypothetical protein HanPSC8_Chr13g0592061 [Helianthus annuus]|nr:hypothetical protein HanPSC8_Chr13g0592061 [Helianthus annuus]